MTANPAVRVQHRQGRGGFFGRKYGLTRPVNCEWFDNIEAAIQREPSLEHWPRTRKVRLIHGMNPGRDDLYDNLNQ